MTICYVDQQYYVLKKDVIRVWVYDHDHIKKHIVTEDAEA